MVAKVRKPFLARASAVACPMPLELPVTSATFCDDINTSSAASVLKSSGRARSLERSFQPFLHFVRPVLIEVHLEPLLIGKAAPADFADIGILIQTARHLVSPLIFHTR